MKRCPSCAYLNSGSANRCGICGRDISAIAAVPVPKPVRGRQDSLLLASGCLLLGCVAGFYLLQGRLGGARKADAPVSAEETFDYGGVISSLEAMAGLRYLPDADQLSVLPLLHSPEEKVACAAAKTAGAMARGAGTGDTAAALLGGLLDAAVSGRGSCRRQAAIEAGFALAQGSYAGELERKAGAAAAVLAGEDTAEIMAAGFFLSSMAGLDDFTPQMRDILKYAPEPALKLYAACALSRLGDAEGYAYLARAVSGGLPGNMEEAVSCLACSASPDAERLLLRLSKSAYAGAAAESAKRALMLRKQLAIIKK